MILSCEIHNFANHKHTALEFSPELNIITGHNGSGKSAISEAIIWCIYGELIRASKSQWLPYSNKTKVILRFDDGNYISRRIKGKKHIVETSFSDKTLAKAIKEDIRLILGDYKTSVLSYIFHRSSLVKFCLSSDSDRRKTIENLLGFDDFDSVVSTLKSAHKELLIQKDSAYQEKHKIDSRHNLIEGKKFSYKEQIEAFKQEIHSIEICDEPIGPTIDEIVETAVYHEKKSEYLFLKGELSIVEDKKEVLGKCEGESVCYACGNKLTKAQLKKQTKELASEEKRLYSSIEEIKQTLAELSNTIKDKTQQNEIKLSEYNRHKASYARFMNGVSLIEKQINQTKQKLFALEKEANQLTSTIEASKHEIEYIETKLRDNEILLRIFGNKGVRLDILADTFNSIAEFASNMMSSVYDKECIVSMFLDKEVASIPINISFDGCKFNSKGLSEGERTILDFVILKALSLCQYKSKVKLPYIYDDIFDSLDNTTSNLLSKCIEEESKTNQVFILTHDSSICDLFNACKIFQLERGNLISE